MQLDELKKLLLAGRPEFWVELARRTRAAREFDELSLLSTLRKKAHARKLVPAGAAALTFCYCAVSLFLFANTFPEMMEIFAALR